MNNPVNQISEVLFELLQKDITRMQIFKDTGILNLTAQISRLRLDYDLDIVCTRIKAKNKHGRSISFGKWHLCNKITGVEVYNKINVRE